MKQKQAVEVVIGQQRLSLRTDQDPARVHRIADLVNKRLGDILPFGQPVSHQVLMLLAMNLADSLLAAEDSGAKYMDEVRERSKSILTQLEREFPL